MADWTTTQLVILGISNAVWGSGGIVLGFLLARSVYGQKMKDLTRHYREEIRKGVQFSNN